MAVLITIAGTDRTNFCDLKSLTITDTIQANSDTMDVDVSLTSTSGWTPAGGNEIVVTNGTGKEFGGVVEEVYEELVGPKQMRYRLGCRDYSYFFDKYLVVDESTHNLSADAWVSRIVSGFTTGFTATNVTTGPTLSGQRFDYVAPTEAVRTIADRSGFGWYIDYDKDIHFFAASLNHAPSTSINIDTSTVYGGVKFRETVSGVKDRVYMKDYKRATSAQWNRSFVGDGTTRFFLLGNEPTSIDPSQMVATLNGNPIDLLIDFVDGAPGTAVGTSSQLFVCFDNQGVRTSSGASAFSSTQTLSVTFNPLEDAVFALDDIVAQAELASREGGDGVHEYAIADPSLTAADGSDNLATLQGSIALARYAFPRLTGSMTTFSSGWRAGQVFDITTAYRMGGFTQTFNAQSVTKKIINHPAGGDPTFQTVIEFADGVLGI